MPVEPWMWEQVDGAIVRGNIPCLAGLLNHMDSSTGRRTAKLPPSICEGMLASKRGGGGLEEEGDVSLPCFAPRPESPTPATSAESAHSPRSCKN